MTEQKKLSEKARTELLFRLDCTLISISILLIQYKYNEGITDMFIQSLYFKNLVINIETKLLPKISVFLK